VTARRAATEPHPRKPNQTIRRNAVKTIVCALVLFAAISAMWGAPAIFADNTKTPNAVIAQNSVDVMQITKEAKNLPAEQFDAH
jgi:hypothetical protein